MALKKIPIPRFVLFFLQIPASVCVIYFLILLFKSPSLSYLALFFASSIGMYFLYKLYRNESLLFLGEVSDEDINDIIRKKQLSLGEFIYTADGFINQTTSVEWSKINKIVVNYFNAYLVDVLELTIYHDNGLFVINEDTNGWPKFLEQLEINISGLTSLKEFFLGMYAKNTPESIIVWERNPS